MAASTRNCSKFALRKKKKGKKKGKNLKSGLSMLFSQEGQLQPAETSSELAQSIFKRINLPVWKGREGGGRQNWFPSYAKKRPKTVSCSEMKVHGPALGV